MEHVLEVRDLHVSYGAVPALRGISFYVDEGEIVALIGPNGAGKTTAMHAISGLLRRNPTSVFFHGKDISGVEAHKLVQMGISQVPEGRGIFPNLTVMENLSLGSYLRNDKDTIREDQEWVMDIFPRLRERTSQIAGTLSGGELQMLSIARSLMARPKLLLMDEPSMGLAPIVVEEIFKTITHINRENHTTILLVEQNALMALMVSNRTYVLEVGTILYEGKSADLRKDENIQKAYLGI
jgi:branched-chain amino acid transport system ATP-binding protein